MILNLGRNSAKFVDNGFIRISATTVNGFVQLSVADSGTGIPLDKRGKLFNKYQASLVLRLLFPLFSKLYILTHTRCWFQIQESLDLLSQGTVRFATSL